MEKQTISSNVSQNVVKNPEVIHSLQDEATKDDVFNAVCWMFSKRQRTRNRVTLKGLTLAMQKTGAKWNETDYTKALERLAGLGFGTLKYNSKNQVIALDNVKVTLQSIGKAALMKGDDLTKTKTMHKNKFVSIEPNGPSSFIETPAPQKKTRSHGVFLTVMINNSPVNFNGPENLKPQDLGEFLLKFHELVKSYK